jgi:hypothetical protein
MAGLAAVSGAIVPRAAVTLRVNYGRTDFTGCTLVPPWTKAGTTLRVADQCLAVSCIWVGVEPSIAHTACRRRALRNCARLTRQAVLRTSAKAGIAGLIADKRHTVPCVRRREETGVTRAGTWSRSDKRGGYLTLTAASEAECRAL